MLAVGATPLIFGAMSHFIPVLTRTRTATAGLLGIPVLALAGGALAVIAASALLVWHRRAGMLGRPHPCLAWYETALACLVLALVAILASVFWPQQAMALRRLHLHLNTLGFVGLPHSAPLAYCCRPSPTGPIRRPPSGCAAPCPGR